jgi:adenine-specific DNA-methyltransferase
MPDKMKYETPNLAAENIEKLSALFPGVVAEGKVNVELLRSYVGEEIFTDEAYEFTWVGKRAAIAEAGRSIRKTLRPCPEESRDWDNIYDKKWGKLEDIFGSLLPGGNIYDFMPGNKI